MRSLILTALLLAVAVPGFARDTKMPPPSIGVSPSRIEATVENGTATGTVTVLNMSNREIHVTTEVVNFDLDEANEVREQPPTPGSLPAALIVNPVDFAIPPNGSQTVRFAVLPERLSGPGEYRAMLFFSELVDTSASALKFRFRLGVPFYATFGEVQSLARLHTVDLNEAMNRLALDISALGNARVRPGGYYLWWPAEKLPPENRAIGEVLELAGHPDRKPPSGTAGGRLVTRPVFPGSRRTVFADIAPPPDTGEHVLVYAVEAGGQSVQRVVRRPSPPAQIAAGH